MQISSLLSIAALATTEVAKSQQARSVQNTATAQDAAAATTVPTVSSTTIRITGLASNPKSQGVPGIGVNQLNSLVQTSLKMQSIRNDASIPEEVKKKLLAPLEQANKEALDVAEAQAEQEEKAKIIEASSEDSEAIRKAGEEIAASADTEGTPPAASAGPTALSSTDEATGTTKAALADSATQTAPAPEAPSSGYSTSPPTSAVGANVDIQA